MSGCTGECIHVQRNWQLERRQIGKYISNIEASCERSGGVLALKSEVLKAGQRNERRNNPTRTKITAYTLTCSPTRRYVEYAMHRVRLLRHHKVQPFVVFDGGPLPAKKGTEVERKQRRDENLAKGNALAAQGKHSDARDYYVKCIDVTPQMAYQLIKVCLVTLVEDFMTHDTPGTSRRVCSLCRRAIRS